MIVGRWWPFRRGCAGSGRFPADRGGTGRFGPWRWLLQDRRGAQRIPRRYSRASRQRTAVDGRDGSGNARAARLAGPRVSVMSPLSLPCVAVGYANGSRNRRLRGWAAMIAGGVRAGGGYAAGSRSAARSWSGVTASRHRGRRRVVILRVRAGTAWYCHGSGYRLAAALSDDCTTASMRIRGERRWCRTPASSD
jgi:hypothetical protein